MAYGPHAVARHEGLVLFVRGAAPGDRVEVQIRERHRNHAFAAITSIERPSDRRVPPPCPIVDRCGGCPWQHLRYESQLAAKHRIVVDQLSRIAGIDIDVAPVLPSPRVYGYRRRLKLRTDGDRLGFYVGGTHELVEVAHCALAETDADNALPAARDLVRLLAGRIRRVEIIATHRAPAVASDSDAPREERRRDSFAIAAELEGDWRPSDEPACLEWLAATPECAGISLRGRRWEKRWGDLDAQLHLEAMPPLTVDATSFTQVNPTANRTLLDLVLRMFGEPAGKAVLEAYAGAGNFSAALAAAGAVVTAVEQSPASCRSARRNAEAFAGRWRIEEGRVETIVAEHARRGSRFDTVLLDPPRSGAAAIVPAIISLRPAQLVYVSCDPATLARDLATLKHHYRLVEARPVDMFPHTYHVETVVHCVLR